MNWTKSEPARYKQLTGKTDMVPEINSRLEAFAKEEGMKGTPIALITAGLLAMAFMGFSGIV